MGESGSAERYTDNYYQAVCCFAHTAPLLLTLPALSHRQKWRRGCTAGSTRVVTGDKRCNGRRAAGGAPDAPRSPAHQVHRRRTPPGPDCTGHDGRDARLGEAASRHSVRSSLCTSCSGRALPSKSSSSSKRLLQPAAGSSGTEGQVSGQEPRAAHGSSLPASITELRERLEATGHYVIIDGRVTEQTAAALIHCPVSRLRRWRLEGKGPRYFQPAKTP